MPTFLLSCHVWLTLKIQANFRLVQEVLGGTDDTDFRTIYVFEVKECNSDICVELSMLG